MIYYESVTGARARVASHRPLVTDLALLPHQPTLPPTPATMTSPSILPLLKALSTARDTVSPEDVTNAIALSFKDELSPVQTGALLTALHFTGLDQKAEIIAAAARAMREAGLKIEGLGDDVDGTNGSDETYSGGLVSSPAVRR